MYDCIDYDCDGQWHTCLFCEGAAHLEDGRGDLIECPYCEGEGGFECPRVEVSA